jgi:hypothetical protein
VPLIALILGPLIYLSPESFFSQSSSDFGKTGLNGLAAGITGLILSILVIRKWLSKKTGFIIDESGITDISNASYTGLVEWNDITKIEGKKVGPIKLIILHTENPEKYINKAKKTAIRQMRKNLHFYGSPVLIVSTRLKTKYDDLLVLIKNEFEKSKRATTQNKTH